MICIESAVEERFPGLTVKKPLIGKGLLKFLRFICHEKEFKQFEESYPHLEGFDFLEQALHYFDFSYRVKDTHREKIPSHGRVVIVSNHPIGSLDGLALLKMVGEIRRDVRVVANELLYAIKPLRSLLLPVDNMTHHSGKQQLREIKNHLKGEGAIIIFPAGEVSRISPTGIKDSRWNSGFLRFATKTQSPILPMYVDGRNSWFFYSLSLLAKPISTLWLIREMFKHAKSHVDISVGNPIFPEQYQTLGVTSAVVSKLFRKHVYRLSNKKHSSNKNLINKSKFASEYEAIAHPENRQLLKREMQACQNLGKTSDGKCIYLYRYSTNSVVIRELGRLRELAFRYVKEGTGKRRDVDMYDRYYDHIVLWDDKDLEIVGAYRMAQSATISSQADHLPALYTETLFANRLNQSDDLKNIYDQGLELGRSFIQPQYWGKRSLDYLWQGIGAYLTVNPQIRYLFGPVSISYEYSPEVKDLLIHFYKNEYGVKDSELKGMVSALEPYQPLQHNSLISTLNEAEGVTDKFKALKSILKGLNYTVPTLYKQYTELCQPGGCQFLAFNVDKYFADCVDGLVLVDLEKVKPEKRKRYLASFISNDCADKE
ncbi:MAG: lysophospholipid acyltransferase family protein [Cellvibrionaceae bacterium]